MTNKQRILSITSTLGSLMAFQPTQHKPMGLRNAFDFSTERLKKAGLFVETFETNGKQTLYASFTKKNRKPAVILNGHLDVVDAKTQDFVLKENGDRLSGRGTADMLGSVALLIELFSELASLKKTPDCALMLVTDEEIGGHNGTKAARDKGYIPKFFIACEPSDEKIIMDAKGVIWLKIETFGKQGHAARPWLYPNPVIKMLKNLQQVKEVVKKDYKKSEWITTHNLTSFHAGKDINQVPDKAEVMVDIRYVSGDDPKKIIHKYSQHKDWKVTPVMVEPPAHAKKKNHYINQLQRASKKKLSFDRQPGATDARFYSEAGVDSIVFGPIGGGYHSENEWVSQSSLLSCYNTFYNFLQNI
ncbi:MAG: M20/M25/M40 family metallo-hydrolase [Candidatus Levybacteria bacterium]|nr:M20/M25/M40 family metallo-hydrolase [Candidatus Levybacteria bacterium]